MPGVHKAPSGAAKYIRKREANGWVEWGIQGSDILLKDLWNEFVERFGGELEDDINDELAEEEED